MTSWRLNPIDLHPGDLVYRYWDTGAMGSGIQPLQVIRVNRLTVTVRTEYGSQFRCPHADIIGRVEWDEPRFAWEHRS